MLPFLLSILTLETKAVEWCELEHAEMFGVVIEFQQHYVRDYNKTECKNLCDYNRTDCNYIKFTQNQYSTECIFYKEIDNIFQDYSIPEYADITAMYRDGDSELGQCPTPAPTPTPTLSPTPTPTSPPTSSPTKAPTTPVPTMAPTTPAPTAAPVPTVSPTPVPTSSPITPSIDDEDDDSDPVNFNELKDKWWFWTIVGLGLLLAITSIIIGVLVVTIRNYRIQENNPAPADPENGEISVEVR